MNRFLIKLASLFVFPALRRRVFRDSRLKPNLYDIDIKKFHALSWQLSSINTLILGSSHAYYGYFAEQKEFNLGLPSCDLYHSAMLYKWCTSHCCPNLRTIIIFYDLFSPGFQLEMTREAFRCVAYRELYGIEPRCPNRLSRYDKLLGHAMIKQHLWDCGGDYLKDYRGNSDFDFDGGYSVAERAMKHIKHNRRETSQTKYLEPVIQIARTLNHRIIIVIPPLRSDFRSHLGSEDYYKELKALVENYQNIKLIDLQCAGEFTWVDFIDCDHLTRRGAEKLASIIRGRME